MLIPFWAKIRFKTAPTIAPAIKEASILIFTTKAIAIIRRTRVEITLMFFRLSSISTNKFPKKLRSVKMLLIPKRNPIKNPTIDARLIRFLRFLLINFLLIFSCDIL